MSDPTRFDRLSRILANRYGRPDDVTPDPARKNASVALVLRRRPTPDLLVIKRAESERDPWSGHMALPGGRLDDADPTLVDTAMRETWEETGLDLAESGALLGRVETVRPQSAPIPKITIWPFVFEVGPQATAMVNSYEVEQVHWFGADDLTASANQSTYRFQYRDAWREFPCIRVDGHVIWGLTYRILTRFLPLL